MAVFVISLHRARAKSNDVLLFIEVAGDCQIEVDFHLSLATRKIVKMQN